MDKRTANALAVLLSKLSITDLKKLGLATEVNQLDAVYLLLYEKLKKLQLSGETKNEKRQNNET